MHPPNAVGPAASHRPRPATSPAIAASNAPTVSHAPTAIRPPATIAAATRRRRLFAGAATLLAAAASVLFAWNAEAAAPPSPSGWNRIFLDDFGGAANTLPSSNNWIIDLGHRYENPPGPDNWGTGEIQSYTASTSNVAQDGAGNLRITPRRDGAGNWTSARIETRRLDFQPPAGGIMRIEGRIQMPNVTGAEAAGYWPAFWALGAPYRGNNFNWPGIGEFDIMENVNGINSVWGVLHCGVAPGGPCNEFSGRAANRPCPGASCQSAFHTYRFEWDRSVSPNVFRWLVDGQQFHSVSQNDVPASTWTDITNHGYFILLNLAIGGAFPDAVPGGQTPTGATRPDVPMLVDYVAVDTLGGSTQPPPPPTSQPPTSQPPASQPPGGGFDAYSRIEAERYSAQNGVGVEPTTDTGGGQNIASLANGDWVRFDRVNFGSSAPTNFQVRVASGAAGGVSGLIQIRIGSPTAPPIGNLAVANTGGWQSWRTVPGNVGGVTGEQTVYVTFDSGQPADFVNLNWFTFVH
jgi:hypothetical protein